MAGTRTGEPGTNEMADLVGPFWSQTRVCDALGVDDDLLAANRSEGTVLGLTASDDGVRIYPVNQFHVLNDGSVEVMPALVPLLQALRRFDPWAVAVLLHTPAPELNNQTPLDWVRHGCPAEVLSNLAFAVSREWAAGSRPR